MRVAVASVLLLVLSVSEEVNAQSFLLQSPVFAQFSVRTSVSVPDRGGVLLGGISSAADSTQSFRPLHRGSSVGRSISHRTISSHVYITDFNELDPFLRQQRQQQQVLIDPVKEKHERQSRAAVAYQKMADKAEKKGKYDLAKWYRQKAREYSAKTKTNKAGSLGSQRNNGKR